MYTDLVKCMHIRVDGTVADESPETLKVDKIIALCKQINLVGVQLSCMLVASMLLAFPKENT